MLCVRALWRQVVSRSYGAVWLAQLATMCTALKRTDFFFDSILYEECESFEVCSKIDFV